MAIGTRQQAIRSLINTWLKIPMKTCATCGKDWKDEYCCDTPVICTNQAAMKYFLKDLKQVRETRKNEYASSKDKTIRFTVSIPSNLYFFLDSAMKRLYNEKLFTDVYDWRWFMKHFPQFRVPEKY